MIMNPSKEEFTEWNRVITRVAKFVAHDFPGVESDDLAQELWIHVLKSKNLVDPLEPRMHALLSRVAKRLAWDHRKRDLYASAQYTYRPSDVRQILRTALDRTMWPASFVPQDAKSLRGIDQLDVSADVSWAWSQLSFSYRDILFRVFVNGDVFESNSTERRRVDRAIEKLAEILNFYRGKPSAQAYQGRKRRTVINNSTARSIIAEQNGSEA